MNLTLDEFITLLNRDLRLEYLAVIQYSQHFGMLQPQAPNLGESLKDLAGEELAHALILAEQIRRLGGVPDVRTPGARTGSDACTLISQDQRGEKDAISRYRQRIAQAEKLGREPLAHILRTILAAEERHLEILEGLKKSVAAR
ncbi:bacterioferritin [Geoalkalibacter ferrihydriticus]|uniref:Ferritin/DPS domain-containing protein n=2 Tax=Geoalkalibacter ferrihydriticus TaxID=392333 RepID=A0A0C2DWI9_9BACT|nr:ferritin-like domain-containing protein [Geoalkalibacter ferrihydriticus]KIH77819.1 hypothetical protein GFER_04060 [Geoalkalibacter ferrihydriticus DSM 17813]SDL80810.1 bacterioferritin [Geoalkalibacter ferrihydriticus]